MCHGRRGHPVGFGSAFRSDLMRLEADAGARSIVQSNASRLQLIQVNDRGVVLDIDRPEDITGAARRQSTMQTTEFGSRAARGCASIFGGITSLRGIGST